MKDKLVLQDSLESWAALDTSLTLQNCFSSWIETKFRLLTHWNNLIEGRHALNPRSNKNLSYILTQATLGMSKEIIIWYMSTQIGEKKLLFYRKCVEG